MFKKFYPKMYQNSTYQIDFAALHDKGYKGILFDIDNTLVEHGLPATERAVELFAKLRGLGYDTCLISNNKEPRVQPFAQAVGSKYIFKAGKPSSKNYKKAMELMGTNTENTLFVGDQLFTDIYGANRAGIYSILVKPIDPKEEIQIVLKRKIERIILYFYQKKLKKTSLV